MDKTVKITFWRKTNSSWILKGSGQKRVRERCSLVRRRQRFVFSRHNFLWFNLSHIDIKGNRQIPNFPNLLLDSFKGLLESCEFSVQVHKSALPYQSSSPRSYFNLHDDDCLNKVLNRCGIYKNSQILLLNARRLKIP